MNYHWTFNVRNLKQWAATHKTLSSAPHLCFERDLFLGTLEREHERDRRGRLVWLVECLSGPTEMGTTASVTEWKLDPPFQCFNVWLISVPGSIAAAIVDWASLTRFMTLSSSLAAACGVISGGLTMALLEWLILKHTRDFTQPRSLWRRTFYGRVKHGLQGSVSEHDPVEGQRPGDRVLLRKLHEGEARRLGLVSGHSHKLYASHLPEELEQLVCRGGLRTGGIRSWSVSWPLTPADLTSSHLRVQVADIDGPPDLINLCRIHIPHEGRLRGHRCREVQTGWHPIHYWKVQLWGKTM